MIKAMIFCATRSQIMDLKPWLTQISVIHE